MKKRTKPAIVSVVIFISIFLCAPLSAAPVSQGSLSMDWTSISFTGIDVTWWSNQNDWYNPAIRINTDEPIVTGDVNLGWGGIVDDTLSTADAYGRSYSDPYTIEVSSYAMADGETVSTIWAKSQIIRSGYFTANESGAFRVSVDYYYSATISSENEDERAISKYDAYLAFADPYTVDRSFAVERDNNYFIVSDDSRNLAESGTLVLEYDFSDGQVAQFAASVFQYSESNLTPVPIPAGIWIFGSGLLSLIGIRRTRWGI